MWVVKLPDGPCLDAQSLAGLLVVCKAEHAVQCGSSNSLMVHALMHRVCRFLVVYQGLGALLGLEHAVQCGS